MVLVEAEAALEVSGVMESTELEEEMVDTVWTPTSLVPSLIMVAEVAEPGWTVVIRIVLEERVVEVMEVILGQPLMAFPTQEVVGAVMVVVIMLLGQAAPASSSSGSNPSVSAARTYTTTATPA